MANHQRKNSVAQATKATSADTPGSRGGPVIMPPVCRRYKPLLQITIGLFVIQLLYMVVHRFELLELPMLKPGYGATLSSPFPRAYDTSSLQQQNPVALLDTSPIGPEALPKTIQKSLPKLSPSSSVYRSTISLSLNSSTTDTSPLLRRHSNISLSNISVSVTTVAPGNETRTNVTDFERIQRLIGNRLSTEWKPNSTFIDEFKKQLHAFTDTQALFVMSQKTVKNGQAINFSINRNRNQVISDYLFKSLPKESPFFNKKFRRCSVVGSGGILRRSRCGAEIDNSDYIFRCNAPPVNEYEVDAGRTTNITTLNPSVVWKRYHSLHSSSDRTKFIKAMQANNGAAIMLPLFSIKAGFATSREVLKALTTAKKPPIKALVIHPKHFSRIQDFWTKRNMTNRLSTGFYLTSVAVALCDDVHLYGFWPFLQDLHGNNVTYHYYNDEKLTGAVHDFPLEFDTLLELHRNGVIHLHVHPCDER